MKTIPAGTIDRPAMFQHDCDECIYLGSADRTRPNDLYVHVEQYPTVIARYGVDGDYISGLEFAEHIPELALAVVRATKLNLLST